MLAFEKVSLEYLLSAENRLFRRISCQKFKHGTVFVQKRSKNIKFTGFLKIYFYFFSLNLAGDARVGELLFVVRFGGYRCSSRIRVNDFLEKFALKIEKLLKNRKMVLKTETLFQKLENCFKN